MSYKFNIFTGTFDLVSTTVATTHPGSNLLLEDGVSNLLLEDGTSAFLTET